MTRFLRNAMARADAEREARLNATPKARLIPPTTQTLSPKRLAAYIRAAAKGTALMEAKHAARRKALHPRARELLHLKNAEAAKVLGISASLFRRIRGELAGKEWIR